MVCSTNPALAAFRSGIPPVFGARHQLGPGHIMIALASDPRPRSTLCGRVSPARWLIPSSGRYPYDIQSKRLQGNACAGPAHMKRFGNNPRCDRAASLLLGDLEGLREIAFEIGTAFVG